jgi:hypothetical protein
LDSAASSPEGIVKTVTLDARVSEADQVWRRYVDSFYSVIPGHKALATVAVDGSQAKTESTGLKGIEVNMQF